MNPILTEAIIRLSGLTNTSAGLTHQLDMTRAKELFKALHHHYVPLPHSDVYTLATANSWPPHHAQSLADLAQRIGNGGRVLIKNPQNWGEPTVKSIIESL